MEDLTKPVAKCLAPFARFEGDFLVSTYLDKRRFPGYDFNTSKVFSLKCLKDLDLSKLEKPITLRELILQPTK